MVRRAKKTNKQKSFFFSDYQESEIAYIKKDANKKQYLEEANIEEQSDLVSRMEGLVNTVEYQKFIDSLDNLLDDWYMEGFEKDDVIEFMSKIIPSN